MLATNGLWACYALVLGQELLILMASTCSELNTHAEASWAEMLHEKNARHLRQGQRRATAG